MRDQQTSSSKGSKRRYYYEQVKGENEEEFAGVSDSMESLPTDENMEDIECDFYTVINF
jgi:hypothetical protein